MNRGGWTDDRIDCAICLRLNKRGACDAWQALGASRDYVPQIQPRRCVQFHPKPAARDQRNGRERWPWLKEV